MKRYGTEEALLETIAAAAAATGPHIRELLQPQEGGLCVVVESVIRHWLPNCQASWPDRPDKPARLMPPRTTRVHHFRSLRGGRVPDDATATETLASVSHARLCTAKHETR